MQPDVLAFTHDHLDHYDPETAVRYLTREPKMTVLAPESVWGVARKNGGGHNYVQFDEGTVWTDIRGLRFTAVKAVHSDPAAIGIVIEETISARLLHREKIPLQTSKSKTVRQPKAVRLLKRQVKIRP